METMMRHRKPRPRRRACAVAVTAVALLAAVSSWSERAVAQDRVPHGRLFPPEDLGLLEGPDRDAWQQPEQVMDALGIADGARVADLGAGGGWFTVRLSRRVGPNGRVYAEDIQPQMIESIARRVSREGLANVMTVLGTPNDPRLPTDLDAVLIVSTYPEMTDPIALLENVAGSLKPNGRVGIIDFRLEGGGPGPPTDERVEPDAVIRDAERAGLQLLAREEFLTYQYLLVFGQPGSDRPAL
jgi:SAM-dependent methyltransferase